MAITPLTQLMAETKLADLARQQRDADHDAWVTAATPPATPVARRAPNVLRRTRWWLGSAMIRLGGLIAGPSGRSLAGGAPIPRA